MKTKKQSPSTFRACMFAAAMLFALAVFCSTAAAQAPQGGPGPRPPQGRMQPPGPGGPGPDMPGGPGGPEMQPLSDEEIAQTLADIKEEDPDLYGELTDIKARDQAMFKNIVSNYHRESRMLENMKQNNPAEYENAKQIHDLNKDERRLSRKYREAKTDADRSLIAMDLKKVLGHLFDLNLAQRQREVEMLENRLRQVKDEIEKRKGKKDEIIERHFDEITGNAEVMRW